MAREQNFSIESGDLKSALDAFSQQSGRAVLYRSDDVHGARSRGFRGTAAPEAALRVLLGGTGFTARFDTSGAIAIVRPASSAIEDDGEGGAPEIIVTAQKREERIEDVPLSITSLSGADLEKQNVLSATSLDKVVPGLTISRRGGWINPAIRGVVSQVTSPGADASVATYVDGVYQPRAFASISDLPDISRITVTKGPQGTLFGRNATGGAIEIFTQEPSFTPTGRISASYGSFNELLLKAFVAAPIVEDKVAFSISAVRDSADSYYRSLVPSVVLDGKSNSTVRAKLRITPSRSVTLDLAAFYTIHSDPTQSYGIPYSFDGTLDTAVTVARRYAGAIVPTNPYDFAASRAPLNREVHKGASAKATIETGLGSVRALVAYNRKNQKNISNGEFAYIPAGGTFYSGLGPNQDENYQAEILLVSRKEGLFGYIVGANYYHDDDSSTSPLNLTSNIGPGSYALTVFSREKTDAYAGFAELTYDLTDRLTVVAGARVSRETRDVAGLKTLGTTYGIPDGIWHPFGHKTSTTTTQRVSLRYAVDDATNAYFTYSTGFKSGFFPASDVGFTPTAPKIKFIKPEHVDAFEVGLKSAASNWLNFNLAAFYYKYKDQQVQVQKIVNGVPLSVTENAAGSRSYGAELEAVFRPTPELSVQVGLAYLNARYTDFPDASINVPAPGFVGNVAAKVDAAGNRMVQSPDFTASATIDYAKDFDIGRIGLVANAFYTTRIYFDSGNIYSDPAHEVINLQASWEPRGTGWKFGVYGRNLTKQVYALGALVAPASTGVTYAAPRTYGVSAAYDF